MAEPVTVASGLMAAATASMGLRSLESLRKALSKPITNFARAARDQAYVALRIGFQDYLDISYDRCRQYKTILNPGVPIDLKENYVHVTLTYNRSSVTDDDVVDTLGVRRRVVITGLAGSGKSMFMKYLTVNKFEEEDGKVPLFVELRHMNSLTSADRNLLAFIRVFCTSKDSKVSQEQFELSLKSGAMILILDGFDELHHEHRDAIQKQILALTKDFPDLTLIISSRPDDRFGAWASFHVYKVDELTKQQCMTLIGTLAYTPGVKSRFLKVVKEKLYESHKSFLSSPLLTTIMLLTYEEFAEIPDKMHAFYSQAFDTLFQRHDAQKEQFQRKTYTGLTREDFKSCLAAFCAMSYLQGRYSFSDDSLKTISEAAVSYLRESDTKSFPKLKGAEFIDDLRESVCLLQQDGIEVSFVHRSFQEYFTAVFATRRHTKNLIAMFDQFAVRFNDSVISMAFDMSRDIVEREWVIPTIERLTSELELNDPHRNLGLVFARLSPAISFFSFHTNEIAEPHFMDVRRPLWGLLLAMLELYPTILDKYKTSPLYAFRPMTLPEAKAFFTKPKRGVPNNFQSFSKWLIAWEKSPGHRQRHVTFTLSPLDDWWLRKLGLSGSLDSLKEGFEIIRADIEHREAQRKNIFEPFVVSGPKQGVRIIPAARRTAKTQEKT